MCNVRSLASNVGPFYNFHWLFVLFKVCKTGSAVEGTFTTTKSITFLAKIFQRGFVARPLLWPWCLKPCSCRQLLPFHLCFSLSWFSYTTRPSTTTSGFSTLTPETALMRASRCGFCPWWSDLRTTAPLGIPLSSRHLYLRLDESCPGDPASSPPTHLSAGPFLEVDSSSQYSRHACPGNMQARSH